METKMVEFSWNGDLVPGYLAVPDGAGPFPGVVVIQEWWGLNDHVKDVVERFAGEGFAAVAPDLYRGQIALEPDEARKLAMELQHEQALKDIQGAVDYLIGLDAVAPKKIGVVGFCMGGGLAALASHQAQNLGAVVVFYGNVRDLGEDAIARNVSVPLMGNFGEADQGIPLDSVNAAEARLKEHGKTVDFHVFPGAPHAFFNDTRPHIYDAAASKEAWTRTISWFRQHLA